VSDERTGRELTPRPEEDAGAVTPREPLLPVPSTVEADRFSAGDQAHTVGLSEERAAAVVRQSGNARMVAFLGALLVVLFIPLYWLYDIGLPVIGMEGRLTAEEQQQYVTDVARGHALYLANCARCHGNDGEGGVGPPLNDQAKLYNALTAQGLPGSGHLQPDYLHQVLRDGGRVVCGDPNSVMPAWEQPKGPLNYREVEEIIDFILATKDVTWTALEGHVEPAATAAPVTEHEGWRDPAYSPQPDATPVPACWRGGGGASAAPGTAAPVESPGTPESPRVVEIQGTDQVQWVDPATGQPLTSLSVVEGETVEFHITVGALQHNFHIGSEAELSTAPEQNDLPGVDTFTNGTQEYTHTFDSLPDQPQFACTVPGHYGAMNVAIVATQPGQPGASPATTPVVSPATSPGSELQGPPLPGPITSPAAVGAP
jgi:mono/diheme cytochrome c family protein